jgi:CubicO group peptidase (beta-lactamase class C family)
MWEPQKLADGSASTYALGWRTGKDFGEFDVEHAGSQQGTSTFFMIVPQRGDGVVVLANMDGANPSSLATELMKILIEPEDSQKAK